MRTCTFLELSVLSHVNRTGRRLVFHPEANLLIGQNRTGKSSLIKTLWWTLGAEPCKISGEWRSLEIKAALRLAINGRHFTFYRDHNHFAVLDHATEHVREFDGVTSQLGPYVADLFDVRFTLINRNGNPGTPTPAFIFLPHYLDQDGGWTQPWNSFARLSQFQNWKPDAVEYYTGIRPNDHFVARDLVLGLQNMEKETNNRLATIKQVATSILEKVNPTAFSIDIDKYRAQVEQLMERCRVIRDQEERFRAELVRVETKAAGLVAQRELLGLASDELRQDFLFMARESNDISCPTCGQNYENGFAERFEVACDEGRCEEMIQEIDQELDRIIKERNVASAQLDASRMEYEAASAILASKQNDVSLNQIIVDEGKRAAGHFIQDEVASVELELGPIRDQLASALQSQKAIDQNMKERKETVSSAFRRTMADCLMELNVTSVSEKSYTRMDGAGLSSSAGGSDGPRSLLAYHFAIKQVMNEFASPVVFPAVIDTVNQQEQDDANLRRMLQFIKNRRPSGTQLILGLVDSKGVDFGGQVIPMETLFGALNHDGYGAALESIRPILARMGAIS